MPGTVKRYLTEFTVFNSQGLPEKWEGPNILAFSFEDAEAKAKIHNQYVQHPIKVIGEWVR